MRAAYFAFDVETTGLEATDSQIISFAATLLDDEFKEIKSLYVYAMPENGCPEEAARINGYTEEKWKERGALTQQDLYNKVSAFVDNAWRVTCVGHNVSFDISFLKALYLRFGSKALYDKSFSWHSIDTLGSSIMFDIAKQGRKGGNYSLSKLCSRFGISLGKDAHDAKADIGATVELFRYLVSALRGDTKIIPPKIVPHKPRPFLVKTGEGDKQHYIFNRGKYEGKALGEIAASERGYLQWVLKDIDTLDDDMKVAIKSKL